MLPACYFTMFQLLVEAVVGAGGDGDSHVVCKHHPKEEVAEAFEFFLREEELSYISRDPMTKGDKIVSFSDGMESFLFSDAKDKVHISNWTTIMITI